MAHVADVGTALGSVYKMVQNGNVVHCEQGKRYIKHIPSRRVTPMREREGAFEIGIWVPD